ncbi:SCO3242 family prenyltransferase [Streptomyces sp. NPDC015345]|uniref:SCO3242 family prenyltransferase n=1 Tax=Streptomyces sp. NPDC015345 TaxID=3364953 RepID=UPI00370319B4
MSSAVRSADGSVARSAARDWAELFRLPALFTVPGDALAGAAATGMRPNRRTLLALTSSLCLYEAGMALNDWADRADDAVERPERPLPSGRISPPAALAAAVALSAAGLALASRAGRPALAVAGTLAGTVWAYDLGLKHTPAGPAAMAAARGLDLLLGATATADRGHSLRAAKHAVPSAGALAAHTLAVTVVSRREAEGGSSAAPLAALAVTTALARLVGGRPGARPADGGTCGGGEACTGAGPGGGAGAGMRAPAGAGAGAGAAAGAGTGAGAGAGAWPGAGAGAGAGVTAWAGAGAGADDGAGTGGGIRARVGSGARTGPAAWAGAGAGAGDGAGTGAGNRARVGAAARAGVGTGTPSRAPRQPLRAALALAYVGTAAKPLFHAVLNPSPPLTQRAVGGGIRAMIPLQAALAARSGAVGTALLTAALAPAARKFARKVSVT